MNKAASQFHFFVEQMARELSPREYTDFSPFHLKNVNLLMRTVVESSQGCEKKKKKSRSILCIREVKGRVYIVVCLCVCICMYEAKKKKNYRGCWRVAWKICSFLMANPPSSYYLRLLSNIEDKKK